MAWFDYRWSGPLQSIATAVQGVPDRIGPVVVGGVAYVAVRSQSPLTPPADVSGVDAATSAQILGVWAGDASPVPATPPGSSNPLAPILAPIVGLLGRVL